MDSSQKENRAAETDNTACSYEKETMRCTEKHLVFIADGQLLMIGMSVLWRGIEARIKLIESDDETGDLAALTLDVAGTSGQVVLENMDNVHTRYLMPTRHDSILQGLQKPYRELAFKVDRHTFAHTITSRVQIFLSQTSTVNHTRLPLSIVPPEMRSILNRKYLREGFGELDAFLPKGWDAQAKKAGLEYVSKLELITNYAKQTLVLSLKKSSLEPGQSIGVDICSMFKSLTEECPTLYHTNED